MGVLHGKGEAPRDAEALGRKIDPEQSASESERCSDCGETRDSSPGLLDACPKSVEPGYAPGIPCGYKGCPVHHPVCGHEFHTTQPDPTPSASEPAAVAAESYEAAYRSLEPHGVARHDPQTSTPRASNPQPSDLRADAEEGPGGESGVPAAAQDSESASESVEQGERVTLPEGQCWVCGAFHPKGAPHQPGEIHRLTSELEAAQSELAKAQRDLERLRTEDSGTSLPHLLRELEAYEAQVERLQGAIEKALNVPGTDCHQHHLVEGRVITFVTPRDSRVVLMEVRAALHPASSDPTPAEPPSEEG